LVTEQTDKHTIAATSASGDEAVSGQTTEKSPEKEEYRPLNRMWSGVVDNVRHVAPEWAVNNSSQVNFALRGIGDWLSISSGNRPKAIYNTETWEIIRYEKAKASSPWRKKAGAISLVSLAAGVVFPERQISEEEKDHYKQMSYGEFIPLRMKQAFMPWDNVLATVGLGTIANGYCTMRSGIEQWPSLPKGVKLTPGRAMRQVPFEFTMGALTMLAGGIMQFMPDQEKAWQLSTSVFLWRIPAAFGQAHRAMFHGIPEKQVAPGDWQLMTKFGLQQASNVFGMFFGGVEKHDGVIHYTKNDPTLQGKGTTAPIPAGESFAEVDPAAAAAPSAEELKKQLDAELKLPGKPETSISAPVTTEKVVAEEQQRAAG
jgi:hypothetical protein